MNKFFVFIFILLIGAKDLQAQIWKGNDIGVDNEVPNPWIPLSIQESTGGYKISCWGRVYEFDCKSLLKQVWAKGDPLLERPVIIKYGINNSWQSVAKRITRKNQNQITIELLSKTVNQKGEVINLRTNILLTYDGLVFYKLELDSKSLLSDAISLEIPIRNEYTKLMHRWNYASNKNKQWWVSGLFPSGDQMSYIPYFWSGNSEKGLFWFAESPYNWRNYENNNAIVLTKDPSKRKVSSAVVLNLVKANQMSSNRWTFEFGLQATPVKPISQEKRNWVLSGAASSTVDVIWPDPGKPYALKHYGYPEPVSSKAFISHVNAIKATGKKALLYNCLSYLSDASVEGKKFKEQWNINAKPDKGSDVRAYADGFFARVNFTDKDYQDFIISKSNQLIKNCKFDGYYLDNVMIENLNANKIVKTFGIGNEIFPYYPIMEARKLHERFYKMVKNVNPKNIVITHSSSRIVPPILGFSDAYISGEQFRQASVHVQEDYLKVATLDAFKTEFSGTPFGLAGIFLPAFEQKNYLRIEPTRALAAVLLQHDIKAWPIYSSTIVWDEINNAVNKFPGFLMAIFNPYYGKAAVAKTDKEDFLISSYRNTNEEYLCIVSNLSDNRSRSVIDFNNLTLRNYTIKQLTQRGKLEMTSQTTITAEVPENDFCIFYLTKKTHKN